MTLTEIPLDVKVRFGGLIAAKSVKYLGRLHHKVWLGLETRCGGRVVGAG